VWAVAVKECVVRCVCVWGNVNFRPGWRRSCVNERTEWTRCFVYIYIYLTLVQVLVFPAGMFSASGTASVSLLFPAWPLTTADCCGEGKKAFIWRTLTHTAVHETCYHSQRFTGNAVYHFLSVRVCLGLRCVWSDCRRESAHRRRTPTGAAIRRRICLSGPKHTLSEDDRSVCCSCSSVRDLERGERFTSAF